MEIKNIIANNIFTLRNKYNLTQQEFADKLSVNFTRGHISRIEKANHIPSAEFIKVVSEAFGVSTDWLLSTHTNNDSFIEDITIEELDLVFKFRKLPKNVQKQILKLIDSINETNKK